MPPGGGRREQAGCWALFALVFLLLLASRARLELLRPQLFGEEGWLFYPEAHADGLISLTWPVGGYLNTVQRIVCFALVWLHLPARLIPLACVIAGLASQLLPALFLASARMAALVPSWPARAGAALLYLALPSTWEIQGNLTNTQWYLQLLAFLVIAAPPLRADGWRRWAWRGADAAALLASGLSGPYCLVLAPICAIQAWLARRDPAVLRGVAWRGAIVAICVVVQLAVLRSAVGIRTLPAALGATAGRLVHIVSGQVVLGLLLGRRGIGPVMVAPWWAAPWAAWAIAAAAIALAAAAMWSGDRLLRLLMLYSTLLFAASMASPMVLADTPQWLAMQGPGMAQRYYFMPMVALLAVLASLAWSGRSGALARLPASVALAVMLCWGVPGDWVRPALPDTRYQAQARHYDAAPPGTIVDMDVLPYGKMTLTRRAD